MELCPTYRSQLQSSSDSDSDGSDKESADWKRATRKVPSSSETATGFNNVKESSDKEHLHFSESKSKTSLKRKRNNIWCEVLEDQMMSETLTHCGLKNRPKNYKTRGEESYDYTLKYKDPRNVKDLESRMSTEEMSECSDDNSSTASNPMRHKHKRFRRMDVENDNSEGSLKETCTFKKNLLRTKEFVKLSKEEIEAARKIIKILNEKKQYIIYRVVKIIGIEKALNLLKMTEQIEENGGMMIMNQARRRTPGGVYFQLLKNDKDVTQEMQDKIFEGEMSPVELKKYYSECKKRKAEAKKLQKNKTAAETLLKTVETNVVGTNADDADAIEMDNTVDAARGATLPSSSDSATDEHLALSNMI